MRISLIGPVYPFRGGIAHSQGMLAQALQQAGHDIQLISFKRQYPAWLYPGQSDRDPSQQHIQLSPHYLLDPLYPWTWQQAVQAVAAFQPDLVLIQWWTVFWGPALAWVAGGCRRKGLPTAFFIHNVLPHEAHGVDAWLARLALTQADAYLTLTQREHQRLQKLLPRLNQPVLTAPLPAFQFQSSEKPTKAAARARLGLPPEAPIFLFFGLVRPYKGLHVLIEAFAGVANEPTQPLLAIAGEFWDDPAAYQAQIQTLGLAGRVRVENRYLPDEEALLWFLAADLFIAPHLDGTQSGALRLALGYGLPVVATDAISQELAGLDPTALRVVPAGDAAALAAALRGWLAAPGTPPTPLSSQAEWGRMAGVVEQLLAAASSRRRGEQ